MKVKLVKSIDHLKKVSQNITFDFFIRLNHGVRSSKEIDYSNKKWEVFHSVSSCYIEYETDKEFIEEEFMIMDAIKDKNLFYIEYK